MKKIGLFFIPLLVVNVVAMNIDNQVFFDSIAIGDIQKVKTLLEQGFPVDVIFQTVNLGYIEYAW